VIVFAVTDPAAGKRGITAFIVPTDSPGYSVARVEDKLGQHASDTCQILFTDLKVPLANRLGEKGRATRLPWATWRAVASGLPHKPSAWLAQPLRLPATMPASA